MKYIKYCLIAVVALLAAACSDDDAKLNSKKDVTVEMAQASFDIKEGRSLVNVPIRVNGESNGLIKLKISVKEGGNAADTEAAKEDIHYYITTKEIFIGAGDTEGIIEVASVDDKEMNDPRVFIITIESVEGATLGTQSQCVVNILDNDTEEYDRLGGEWIMTYTDLEDTEISTIVTFETYGEDDSFRYKRIIDANGEYIQGEGTLTIRFNETENSVSIMGGSHVAYGLSFGNVNASGTLLKLGVCNLVTGFVGSSITTKGSISARWNEDFTEIDFGSQPIYILIETTEADSAWGEGGLCDITYYDAWNNIKFTRPE